LGNDDEEQWISILNIYSINREKKVLYIQQLNGEKTYSRQFAIYAISRKLKPDSKLYFKY
jgi:hypothetical protein